MYDCAKWHKLWMQTRAHTVAAWCICWNCSSLAVPTSTGKSASSTEHVWKHPASHTKLVFFWFFSSAQRTQPSLGQLPTSPQRLVSQERKREQEQAAGGGQMCSERIHCLVLGGCCSLGSSCSAAHPRCLFGIPWSAYCSHLVWTHTEVKRDWRSLSQPD